MACIQNTLRRNFVDVAFNNRNFGHICAKSVATSRVPFYQDGCLKARFMKAYVQSSGTAEQRDYFHFILHCL